ncbi:hypothetical protein ACFOKF_17130 [Sphingobium rhizovicinum]|uniref:Nickel/cobalt efflux system n=1 Tax=Sphingobium rhizovicinum TaxID=432308 RepID=A0ABV7NIS9_9SPHN
MIDPAALSLPVLIATAFALGARHGVDADHLSVVDAIARRDALVRPWSARLAGASFALGHILVVTLVALLACLHLDRDDAPPDWLAATGVGISATTLILLGIVNLRAASRPARSIDGGVRGWRSRWLRPADRHWLILLTGALFAISFDTIAIALGLGLAGQYLGGWHPALLACAAFGGGMMLVGLANGALTVQLLRTAGDGAAMAARAMTLIIGLINLALGVTALAALSLPRLDQWREAHGGLTSAAIILLFLTAFACLSLAQALRARRRVGSATAR